MRNGNKNRQIPSILEEDLKKKYPGMNSKFIQRLIGYLNDIVERRKTPFILFFKPDLEEHARNLEVVPKDLFNGLQFLVSFFPSYVEMKIYFEYEDLFFQLLDDDIEILREENRVYNPDNPKIFFDNADQIIRHAFVIKYTRTT